MPLLVDAEAKPFEDYIIVLEGRPLEKFNVTTFLHVNG
jgi:hypothetical protein